MATLDDLKILLGKTDDSEDALLSLLLNRSTEMILNKRFPFGTTLTEVPTNLYNKLLDIAVVLYNKRGAEGQMSHSENGISRTYFEVDQILSGITSYVGAFVDAST